MDDQWGKGAKYWDHAWNPVIGCRPVSEGCEHCYAESMAERFPELQDDNGGFEPHQSNLGKKPPKSGVVFVGNMTDLFGEWNPPEKIVKWLGSLEHYNATNLILTKRPEQMREILDSVNVYESIFPIGKSFIDRYWWGVTAENHERLEERLDPFLRISCARRWLSLEPLLGEICLNSAFANVTGELGNIGKWVQWVVVGAESGPDRRPCKLEWVELIVEQCLNSGVPVFVKQLDINGRLEKDINKFPPHLQIRQVPWTKGE